MKDETITISQTICAAFTDEYGEIDLEVYRVSEEVLFAAQSFADRILHDRDRASDLLANAAALTTRAMQKDEIANLRAYIFLVFKRLVLAELRRDTRHEQILAKRALEIRDREDSEADVNRKILIHELRRRMDLWMREVFDLLSLGYEYEDLVPRFGSAANVIRSKYSKRLAKLAREIHTEMAEVEDQRII